MAETRLSDVYVPKTFARLIQQSQIELNAFIASGVAVADPILTKLFANGGNTGELPQYNGITVSEPNYSNDVAGDIAVADKIDTNVQMTRSASANNHWTTMDLTRELAIEDPVGAITGRIGHYWAQHSEKRVINSLMGVLADNVANDSSDMLHTVATDAAGAVTDAERISSQAIALAAQTMGDHSASLRAIAMHSITRTRLVIQDLIKEHRDNSSGKLLFETYVGMRVIVDDSLPAVMGSERITYTSILFGANALGFGTGKVETPTAVTRNELAGNGGGMETLTSRVNNIFHPNGGSFLSTLISGQSANYADLASGANWDRVVPRKGMPIAFLQTND